jgi:hypothetical protein
MNRFLTYALSRLQERSTVGGLAAAGVAAFGLHTSPDHVASIVNLIVLSAGLVTAAIPGGK